MDNIAILISSGSKPNMLENLGTSTIASVIGMGIVFLVLALLIVCIMLLSKVLSGFETQKENKENTVEIAQQEQIIDAPVVVENTVTSDEQKRIVAAITAALTIAAFDKPNVRFIVKKIRKI